MSDTKAAAVAAMQKWLANNSASILDAPAGTAAPADQSQYARMARQPGRAMPAFNRCALCGLETRDAKYCPYCGPELIHVGPEARCPNCTEQVLFAHALFCGWCGKPLTTGGEL